MPPYTIRTPRVTYDSQVLKRPSLLNIPEGLVQIHQLFINKALGLLRALHGLQLKGINSFDLPFDIISDWLERLEMLFNLVDDSRVLQHALVVCKVHILGVFAQLLDLAAGIIVPFLECDESIGGAAFEAELR
jgi:hypothetical protein